MPRTVHCDFCYAVITGHAWDCPCSDFDYEGPRTSMEPGAQIVDGSVGSWLACDSCVRLVKEGDREMLSERALRRALARLEIPYGGQMIEPLLRDLRALHDRFWSHRAGEPVQISSDQLALIASDPAFIREPR